MSKDTLLSLAHLDGNPPTDRQELEEAFDAILMAWSDYLADYDEDRVRVAARLAFQVEPFIDPDRERDVDDGLETYRYYQKTYGE